ncbi:hypothetical protein PI126_g14967 [Phytophthora idaei]|nr:hypothetical protein PI126_g14967 [Phytophthora idaei]
MFNQKTPDEAISLIGTFTARYGDDAVAKALVSAERRGGSKVAELAKQLRAEQLSFWLDSGKSVDDVFKLLKLSSDGYKAIISRKMVVLDDYIAKFNNAKRGQESLLKTLTTGFGGERNFLTILAMAKTDEGAAMQARELMNGLLKQWRRENVEPARIMKLLNLDNDVEKVLRSGNLGIFDKYIAMFNERNPHTPVSLLAALTSKYGEANLAEAIVSAAKRGDMLAARL